MFDEVNVDEDPALADLGAGDLTDTCLFLQRHGMDVQERCSGLQIERVHVQIIRSGVVPGHRGTRLRLEETYRGVLQRTAA